MRPLHFLGTLLLVVAMLSPLSCSTGTPPDEEPPATTPADTSSISASAGRMSGGDYSVIYQLGHPTTAASSGTTTSAAPALPIVSGAGR